MSPDVSRYGSHVIALLVLLIIAALLLATGKVLVDALRFLQDIT